MDFDLKLALGTAAITMTVILGFGLVSVTM